ncbi:MAG TPA: tRNA pseudouridine(38-40) synthase TruA [Bacillota bacterium]
MSRRLALRLAYDGTDFHGFQRQGERPTIQLALEQALAKLAGRPVRVVAAGRTDAGVHAAGQVVHCDFDRPIPVDRLPLALNSLLPPDIVVYECREVAPDFHAQFDATGKVYRYSILHSPHPWPFLRRYVLHHPEPLAWDRIQACVPYLRGRRDFASFQSSGREAASTVRTLRRLEIQKQAMDWGTIMHLIFEADGFLYRMVRNIVGTLLEVGRGRRPPRWVAEVLEARDRRAAGPTAPAHGLTLQEVHYPPGKGIP